MRFIPTTVHAMLDYLVGLVLILAPLVWIDTAPVAAWIPMILGAGVIIYSLLTAYEYSLAKLIPVPIHLGLDVLGGIFLAVSPWLFQFAGDIWAPHVIIGLLEIAVAAATATRVGDRRPAPGARASGRPARDAEAAGEPLPPEGATEP